MQRTIAPVLLAGLLACQAAPPEPAGAQPATSTISGASSVPREPPGNGQGRDAPVANPAMGSRVALSDAHWKDFPGPKRSPSIGHARKAWGIRPVSDSFDAVTLGLLSVKQVAGDVVIVDGYVPAHVPGAFMQPQRTAKGLKPGAPVVVDTGGSAPTGRVVTVGSEVGVKYLWHGRVARIAVAPDRLLALKGKVAFAEPVIYRSGKAWKHGRVAYAGPGRLWIIGDAGKPQPIGAADARPLPTQRVHKKGDAVRAVRMGAFESAEIGAVLDDGVAYEVRFADDGSKSVVPYDWIAPLT